MSDAIPYETTCVCGEIATLIVDVDVAIEEHFVVTLTLPLCEAHGNQGVIRDVRLSSIATHEPHPLVVVAFPPGQGEIASAPEGGTIVGCPTCGGLTKVPDFVVDAISGRLSPRFVCPHCRSRIWLHVDPKLTAVPPTLH